MLGHFVSRPWKRALFWLATRVGPAGLLLVHSERQLTNINRVLGRRWSVEFVQYHVDCRYWTPAGTPPATPTIVAAGSENRDYECLVEAARGLDTQVVIAAGSHWARTLAGATDVPPNVTYLSEALPFAALRELYQRAMVVVVPLRNVANQSGVTTMLEAMACGVPIVVSATAGQREVLKAPLCRADSQLDAQTTADRGAPAESGAEPAGLYVPVCDSAALRAAIKRLLADAIESRKLGDAGRVDGSALFRHESVRLRGGAAPRYLGQRTVTLMLSACAWAVAVVALAFSSWWMALAVLALRPLKPPRDAGAGGKVRFVVVVPAHNEAGLIEECVRSLRVATQSLNVEIVVVADNCTDETARIAAAAGARVFVRQDAALRGKPYALGFALSRIAAQTRHPEVVAFVDGDSTVAPNFFVEIERAFAAGAEAAQVMYLATEAPGGVAALRAFALALLHRVRPLGQSRLGLPTTLKGNGMALRWELVAGGFPGIGLTEDASATLALAADDIRVRFVPRTAVYGAMPRSAGSISKQDRRWEGGRLRLAPRAIRVASCAALTGKWQCAAAAADVASPPLSMVAFGAGASATLGAVGVLPLWVGVAPAAALTGYVFSGWLALGARGSDMAALAWAPVFLVRKALTYATLVRPPVTWQRTGRD